MKQISEYSVAELQQVIAIKEHLESLEHKVASILGDGIQASEEQPVGATPAKRKLSAAHRRKLIKALAKARKARWAKANGTGETPKKRHLSAKGRAAIAAAARKRWAKVRKAKA